MKKVLITGYSGFVGSHLLPKLINDFDISLLGRSKPNIVKPHFVSSINHYDDYTTILKGIDVVVHLAARVHVMDDKHSNALSEFRAVNLGGTINLANQAAKMGVKRFIFISTIKVNGEKTSIDKPFSYLDKRNPQNEYALSKAEAELQLESISHKTSMEYVLIRPPLVYGYGVKANFSALLSLVGNNIPLPFRLLNRNKRSLVSVYNLTDLIKTCILHPNAGNQVFLVSDNESLSTYEMVKLMAKVQKVKPFFIPFPSWVLTFLGLLFGKSASVSRLTESLEIDMEHTKVTLGWEPPFSVKDGFENCLKDNLL